MIISVKMGVVISHTICTYICHLLCTALSKWVWPGYEAVILSPSPPSLSDCKKNSTIQVYNYIKFEVFMT